jgi:FixJ family two-component response regulator
MQSLKVQDGSEAEGNSVARPALTVFVIDDESVRTAVRRLIQPAGVAARTFASADDYLDAALPPPDCLILDVRMPGGLGGLELQRRLAIDGPRVPIVFITAHQDVQTRDSALAAGSIAFLQKPFEDQALLEAVGKATGQRRASEPGEV